MTLIESAFGYFRGASLLVVFILCTLSSHASESKPLVLVELYTSEGCSSCPSADKLLAELQASQPVEGVTIVPMALHVDYWDRLGWKDPFADASNSQRQRSYAAKLESDSVYTPQMIVNGRTGFVGSDRGAALNAIKRAADQPVAAVAMKKQTVGVHGVTLDLRIGKVSAKDAVLWAAVVEDDLDSAVTRGENQGRHLKHQAVVRVMRGDSYVPPAGDQDSVQVSLPWDAAWKREHCRVIVAVQSRGTGTVYALGQFGVSE